MRRTIVFLMLVVIALSCAGNRIVHLNFTEKFEGLTQLVLASQTTNLDFTERISKRILGIFPSNAKVKVTSNVTYDFYLDFDKDGYKATYDKKQKILHFEAPPIRVKKPVINASTVTFPETGLLVNEEREAMAILQNLTDRFMTEGEELLAQEKVSKMCREKLTEFLRGLSQDFGYNVEKIDIIFRKEKPMAQSESL